MYPTPSVLFLRGLTASYTDGVIVGMSRSGDSPWTRATLARGIPDGVSAFYDIAPDFIQAIDQAGHTIWVAPQSGVVASAIGPNQSLIVAQRNRVSSLSRTTGTVLWSVSTSATSFGRVQVADGKVYLFSDYIYVLDASTGRGLGRSAVHWGFTYLASARCTPAGLVLTASLTVYRYDHC